MSDKRKPIECNYWEVGTLSSTDYINEESRFLPLNMIPRAIHCFKDPIRMIEHSAYLALEAEALKLEAALEALAKRHDWTPGMGQCICQQHADAEAALAQFKKWRGGE